VTTYYISTKAYPQVFRERDSFQVWEPCWRRYATAQSR
jgi:hypothetical protein